MRIDLRLFLSFCLLFPIAGCGSETTEVADVVKSVDTPFEETADSANGGGFSMNDLSVSAEDANSEPDADPAQPAPPPAAAAADSIPQQVKDAPVRNIVQPYPDKKPHRAFAAKMLAKNSIMYHGPYVEFYPDGAKQKNGSYEYGKKVGEWTLWSKEGVVRKKGSYANDTQEGDWHKYRADGSLDWIERYANGLADGTWEAFGEDGKTPLWRRSYKAGQRHGLWEDFYPDGAKRFVQNYANGELDGPSKSWFANGKLTADGEYRDGKRHGTFRSYGPTGNLRDQTQWQQGKQIFGT